MAGDIDRKMAKGMERSAVFVCFVTRDYLQKASGDGPNGGADNCKYEYDYFLRRR